LFSQIVKIKGESKEWHMLLRDHTVLPAPSHLSTNRINHAFAFSAAAGPHLLTLEGWKAEFRIL